MKFIDNTSYSSKHPEAESASSCIADLDFHWNHRLGNTETFHYLLLEYSKYFDIILDDGNVIFCDKN